MVILYEVVRVPGETPFKTGWRQMFSLDTGQERAIQKDNMVSTDTLRRGKDWNGKKANTMVSQQGQELKE